LQQLATELQQLVTELQVLASVLQQLAFEWSKLVFELSEKFHCRSFEMLLVFSLDLPVLNLRDQCFGRL